jgi:hypothetical protein
MNMPDKIAFNIPFTSTCLSEVKKTYSKYSTTNKIINPSTVEPMDFNVRMYFIGIEKRIMHATGKNRKSQRK